MSPVRWTTRPITGRVPRDMPAGCWQVTSLPPGHHNAWHSYVHPSGYGALESTQHHGADVSYPFKGQSSGVDLSIGHRRFLLLFFLEIDEEYERTGAEGFLYDAACPPRGTSPRHPCTTPRATCSRMGRIDWNIQVRQVALALCPAPTLPHGIRTLPCSPNSQAQPPLLFPPWIPRPSASTPPDFLHASVSGGGVVCLYPLRTRPPLFGKS